MNLREALAYGEKALKMAGIAESKIDAWLLFEFVTKMNRTKFFMNGTDLVSESDFEKYKALIEKRKQHYPLQYITCVQQFCGYDFYVDESVLIPRSETEELVGLAKDSIKAMLCTDNMADNRVNVNKANAGAVKKLNILDMCTGSGCIAVSIALSGENVDVTAVDISPKALDVAKKNAKKHNACVEFVKSDLFENLTGEKYDIIVSNPPYIETKELSTLMEEVIKYEPVCALDGKEDGLYFYRKIIKESINFLNEDGKLMFEIGYNQGKSVSLLMEEAGFHNIKIIKDLSGLDRIVCGGI